MKGKFDTSVRSFQDLEFLSEVTRETLSSLELGTILRRVVELVRNRFGYDYAAIALVEDDVVAFRAGSGGDLDLIMEDVDIGYAWRIPVGQGIVGTAVSRAEPRLVNQVEQDPTYIKANFLAGTRSELAVPLSHHGQVLGVLDVQSNKENAFGQDDVRLLEILGAMVAPAVHIAGLYEAELRRVRHLQLVGEISRLVMFSLDRNNVVSVACKAIMETLDVSFVGIALLERGRNRLVHAGHASDLPLLLDPPPTARLGEGLIGQVAARGLSARVEDITRVPGFIHMVPGMQSALCVPLRVRDEVIGVVDVEHCQMGHFTEEDEVLLNSLAAYLAQATENAQLFENQRRRWQQLLLINEVTRIATEPYALQEILALMAREIHDRFGYFAVAVALANEREVVIRALASDEPMDRGPGHSERLDEGISGQVARTGESFMAGHREEFEGRSALRGDIQSMLCVPLRAHKKIIGVIQVQGLGMEGFDDDDRLVLETLAKSVAGAIANARSIRQNEQLREDLSRMIVHDLRNPVQNMILKVKEVQRTAGASLTRLAARSLDEGHAQAEEFLNMVNSLLDVARFEAGQTRLRLTPAVLNDHLREALMRLTPQVKAKGIEVTTFLSQDVPVVWIDPELISRTLVNLVSNAIKFTGNQGQVILRTRLVSQPLDDCATPPPFVLVSVEDTGEGIPAQYHQKIFEKFGQVESRKAGINMSTGLGLAFCRYVVEAHGGRIWVMSEPQKGAVFQFSLPQGRPKI